MRLIRNDLDNLIQVVDGSLIELREKSWLQSSRLSITCIADEF